MELLQKQGLNFSDVRMDEETKQASLWDILRLMGYNGRKDHFSRLVKSKTKRYPNLVVNRIQVNGRGRAIPVVDSHNLMGFLQTLDPRDYKEPFADQLRKFRKQSHVIHSHATGGSAHLAKAILKHGQALQETKQGRKFQEFFTQGNHGHSTDHLILDREKQLIAVDEFLADDGNRQNRKLSIRRHNEKIDIMNELGCGPKQKSTVNRIISENVLGCSPKVFKETFNLSNSESSRSYMVGNQLALVQLIEWNTARYLSKHDGTPTNAEVANITQQACAEFLQSLPSDTLECLRGESVLGGFTKETISKRKQEIELEHQKKKQRRYRERRPAVRITDIISEILGPDDSE